MESSSSDWPFPDPPNCAVIVSRRIIYGNEPALSVQHDGETGWFFWDGSEESVEDAMVVGLGRVIKRDPGLLALCDLPFGWRAWRPSKSDNWEFFPEDDTVGVGE